MHPYLVRSLRLAFTLGAAAVAVQAQTAPQLKPGLWQIHSDREVNGQKVPDASDHMKDMSPEKRAQFEAMMKQRGIPISVGGMTQVCYTREALEKSPWADQLADCKATYSNHSASAWKWHTSCPKYALEADGEAAFPDHENYTVKSISVSKINDTVRNSSTTMTGKWLGSDCGDVKPFDAKP